MKQSTYEGGEAIDAADAIDTFDAVGKVDTSWSTALLRLGQG